MIGGGEFNYDDLELNKLDFVNYLLKKVEIDNGNGGFVDYLDLELFELDLIDYEFKKGIIFNW